MYALWEQDIGAAEIARRCRAGLASVAAFEIPRRSVHAICTAIEKERAAPRTLDEAAEAVAQGRHQERVFAMLNEEVVRLEAKQHSGPLTVTDLERAEKAAAISASLERRLRRRAASRPTHDQRSDSTGPRKRTPLDELAAEEARKAENEVNHAQETSQGAPSNAEGGNGVAPHYTTEGTTEAGPKEAEAASSHTRTCPERSDTGEDADAAKRAASESTAVPSESSPNAYRRRVLELSRTMPTSEARATAIREGLRP